MSQATPQKNRMGTEPIPKLMISMGAPMMLSMFVQALYNIVDSLYVSHIPDTAAVVNAGDKAVAALSLAFPIQMLITSLCVGTGVGDYAFYCGRPTRANDLHGVGAFLIMCTEMQRWENEQKIGQEEKQ